MGGPESNAGDRGGARVRRCTVCVEQAGKQKGKAPAQSTGAKTVHENSSVT